MASTGATIKHIEALKHAIEIVLPGASVLGGKDDWDLLIGKANYDGQQSWWEIDAEHLNTLLEDVKAQFCLVWEGELPMQLLVALRHDASDAQLRAVRALEEVRQVAFFMEGLYGRKMLSLYVPTGTALLQRALTELMDEIERCFNHNF